MQLKYALEMVTMDDEIVAVPVGDCAGKIHGVLKLNKAGQEILELLKQNVSEDRIVDVLTTKYENDRSQLVDYVRSFLEVLRENELIIE